MQCGNGRLGNLTKLRAPTVLYLFVRGITLTKQACHPVTAAVIEVSGVDGTAGWSDFSRTITHVRTNPAFQSASYGLGVAAVLGRLRGLD